MLIGARQAGFQVVGNIDWRPYYHTGTFEKNFPGAWMEKSLDPVWGEVRGIDLAMGHPECGNFSNLQVHDQKEKRKNPGDIPLFVEMIQRIAPRFFVMDNLPRALIAYNMKMWAAAFPDYDLFPEWVSNYHYGNSQKNRRRFFMIGARREEGFVFKSGEFEHETYLGKVVEDLPVLEDLYEINHIHRPDSTILAGWAGHQFGLETPNNKITLGLFKTLIKDIRARQNFPYMNRFGEKKKRPGYCKIILDNYSPVMTGGGLAAIDNHYRDDTLNPLTIRERARIQGCPDDFIFYPLDYTRDHKTYSAVYKQTGKFMPVEFCRYVSRLIRCHMDGIKLKAITRNRFIKRFDLIDEAKRWYCRHVEYSTGKDPCEWCWLTDECLGPGRQVKKIRRRG